MRRIQIVDLDGCISDDRWRRHLINKAQPDPFHEYHSKCIHDSVVNLHEITGEKVVVLTGRPLRYREQTMAWLSEVACINPLFIMFRNDYDRQPSSQLKKWMVASLLDVNSYGIYPEEIIGAIDDLEPVVQMYRKDFGFNAKVVRIGEEEHANG